MNSKKTMADTITLLITVLLTATEPDLCICSISPATTGQTVSLNFETPPSFSPTCTTLSAGQPYNLTAIVDDSTAGGVWSPFVTLYTQPRNSAATLMCQVESARNGCMQNGDNICCPQTFGPNTYKIHAQGIAEEILSLGQVRIEWLDLAFVDSKEDTANFSEILGDSSLDVSVNNNPVCSSSGHDSCEVDLTEGETVEFSCCVTGLENATLNVTYFNGNSSEVNGTCTNGTVALTVADTRNYECFAVDGCGRTVAVSVTPSYEDEVNVGAVVGGVVAAVVVVITVVIIVIVAKRKGFCQLKAGSQDTGRLQLRENRTQIDKKGSPAVFKHEGSRDDSDQPEGQHEEIRAPSDCYENVAHMPDVAEVYSERNSSETISHKVLYENAL